MKVKYIIAYALVSLLAIVLVVALGSGKPKKQTNKEPVQNTIMQTKDDLLAGEYKAVCYSGFRSGQHPDRGEGAINPTAAQVLEDLFIIQNDMGFKLIRLYDSGENSKTVLEVIQKNDLDIKVMQGIWLKAELSAHETCEWLTEPIPQETLNKNKIINKEEIQRVISLANKYDSIIVAISVGNEALVDWNDHKVHADSIIKYCKIVSKSVKQPITVADNYLWWAHHGKKLSKVLDFISIHVYPVWEGKDINEGLSYSIQNIQQVRDSLPEERSVIDEAG